jgi:RHO1 GDP-GTP exchange protein 1/2
VITFPLEALDANDPMAGLRRAKKISSHTTFFKAGVCLGKTLVCVVKSSPLSSTIKTLEPIDQNIRGRAKPTFKKLLQGGNDTLKPFRVCHVFTLGFTTLLMQTTGVLYPGRIEFNSFPED